MSSSVQSSGTTQAQLPPSGWITTANAMYSSTNLDLAIRQMNSIGQAIHEDLAIAEQEVSAVGAVLTENNVNSLNEFCRTIRSDIETKYRDASEKAARMDLGRTSNIPKVMEDNIGDYQARLRQILADLRRAGSSTPSSIHRVSPAPSAMSGYKPYIERLKPLRSRGR